MEKNFYDQPIDCDIKQKEEIRNLKTGQLVARCLLLFARCSLLFARCSLPFPQLL